HRQDDGTAAHQAHAVRRLLRRNERRHHAVHRLAFRHSGQHHPHDHRRDFRRGRRASPLCGAVGSSGTHRVGVGSHDPGGGGDRGGRLPHPAGGGVSQGPSTSTTACAIAASCTPTPVRSATVI